MYVAMDTLLQGVIGSMRLRVPGASKASHAQKTAPIDIIELCHGHQNHPRVMSGAAGNLAAAQDVTDMPFRVPGRRPLERAGSCCTSCS